MKIGSLATFFAALMIAVAAFSQTANHWVEKTTEVQVEEKNPNVARRLLLEDATQKISEEMIRDIIGEAKFSRNHALIQNKILKSSSRFVPVAKPGDLLPIENGFKMSVTLKINQDDLQALLLENGLFYDADSTPMILPMVTMIDKTSSATYAWWKDGVTDTSRPGSVSLPKMGRELESKLRGAFWKNNFYMQKPQTFHFAEVAAGVDKLHLASEFNAPLFIEGEITVGNSNKKSDQYVVVVHLIAVQTQNGRSIAEVHREYETDTGKVDLVVTQKLKENLDAVSVDLAQQVLEAWQKGAIGANLFRLAILGKIPVQQQETLKEGLRSNMKAIKNVRERLITSDEFVLEVDSNLSPKEFLQKLPQIKIGGFSLTGMDANDKEVRYKLAVIPDAVKDGAKHE